MTRRYRAVPVDETCNPPLEPKVIEAGSDLDAMMQARDWFGSSTTFVLWDGERHVLNCLSANDRRRRLQIGPAAA